MKIGIVPVLNPSKGGIYQYGITMMHALNGWGDDGCKDEFIVFTDNESNIPSAFSAVRGWTISPLAPPKQGSQRKPTLTKLRAVVGQGPHVDAVRRLRRRFKLNVPNPEVVRFNPEMSQWFRQLDVDLMFYTAPNTLSFETKLPYVMAIHDLQHRLQPEFPEVSADGEWERREYMFRNGARYATLLLADSEVGKEDILNFYGPFGVTADRVKVLPFLPACYLVSDVSEAEQQRVQAVYNLPENYLFYPAQFWPHKNHARIIKALGLLKRGHNLKIPLVLAGSHTGNIRESIFNEVVSLASKLGIEKEIRYLGYVPDSDMSSLYGGAVALVMPTFFGPTNIPVLEAWSLGCAVLTSDIRGIREQVGDAAIRVDPRSVEAIADGIYRLWTDEDLRRSLIERGRRRLAAYTADDYGRRLIEIVENAKTLMRSEGPRIASH